MKSLLGISVQSLCQGHRLKSSELYQQREEGPGREKPTMGLSGILRVLHRKLTRVCCRRARKVCPGAGERSPSNPEHGGGGVGGGGGGRVKSLSLKQTFR